MSSLLNYYSQVDIQVKNFLALATTTVYTPNTNARIESLMSDSSFTSATTSSTYASQTLRCVFLQRKQSVDYRKISLI